MRVFDCFTYYNEEDILNIRLNELNDYVDYFVIVEASETFTGNRKPFYLDNFLSCANKFLSKIIRVKVIFNDKICDPWEREHFQRNQIMQGLLGASKNDLILISDVDEIINTSAFNKISKIKNPIQLDNYQYFWNFNWRAPQHCNQGARPVACKMKHLVKSTPQELRAAQLERIPNAGWHFSYYLNSNDLVTKIESFAHTEYNKDEYKSLEAINYRIENGIDPFDRFPLKYYEIDATYPKYIQDKYI